MKKALSVFLSGVLLLTLAACVEKEPAPFDPAADAQALLSAPGVFSGELEPVEQATACALYGIDESAVTSCEVYMANAASAEELALFLFTDADAAQAAVTQLGYRVEDRIDGLSDYLPQELPKLEKAVVEQRGCSALLLVAADYDAARDVLDKSD